MLSNIRARETTVAIKAIATTIVSFLKKGTRSLLRKNIFRLSLRRLLKRTLTGKPF